MEPTLEMPGGRGGWSDASQVDDTANSCPFGGPKERFCGASLSRGVILGIVDRMNEIHSSLAALERRLDRGGLLDVEIHPTGRFGARAIARGSSYVPGSHFERCVEVRAHEPGRACEEQGSRRGRLCSGLGHAQGYGCQGDRAQDGRLLSGMARRAVLCFRREKSDAGVGKRAAERYAC